MNKQQLSNEYDVLLDNINNLMNADDMSDLIAMYTFATNRINTIFHAKCQMIINKQVTKEAAKAVINYTANDINAVQDRLNFIHRNSIYGVTANPIYMDTDSIKQVKED